MSMIPGGAGGVLPVMKYIKGQGNLSFWSVKRPKRPTDAFLVVGKSRKRFGFLIYLRQCICNVK